MSAQPEPVPAQSARGWRPEQLALLVAAAVLGYHLLDATVQPPFDYDEGLAIVGGWRCAQGQLPYRDFHTLYGPLEPGVLGLLFQLTGPELLVYRAWRCLCFAGLVWLAGGFLARRAPLGLGLLAVVALVPKAWMVNPALVCVLATGRALEASLDPEREPASVLRWSLLTGLLISLTAAFRPDFGAAAGLAVGAVVAGTRWRAGRPPFAAWVWAGAGLVPGLLIYALVFGLTDPQHRADWLGYGERVTEYRHLPFEWGMLIPGDPQFLRSLYLVALAGPLALAIHAWRALGPSPEDQPSLSEGDARGFTDLAYLTAVWPAFAAYGTFRLDEYHLFPALLITFLLAAAAFLPLDVLSLPRRRLRQAALVCCGLGLALVASRAAADLQRLAARWQRPGSPPGMLGVTLPKEKVRREWDRAAEAAREALRPGETVYVGPRIHARFTVVGTLLYALIRAPIATRWHHLDPGFTTRVDVQERLIAELEANRVGVIVLDKASFHEEANKSAELGDGLLDDWIAANTRGVYRGPRFLVLRRTSSGEAPDHPPQED